jgi:hypothetical protein
VSGEPRSPNLIIVPETDLKRSLQRFSADDTCRRAACRKLGCIPIASAVGQGCRRKSAPLVARALHGGRIRVQHSLHAISIITCRVSSPEIVGEVQAGRLCFCQNAASPSSFEFARDIDCNQSSVR